jgi:D-glycero-D-manno-heptose 1,7-bisphosphate phosphatase
MKTKAIFLDKDGTLIENIPYNIDPEKIRLYQGVPEALQQLKSQGFKLIIVTNQPGVALGYFEEQKINDFWRAFDKIFSKAEVAIDGFYYCPHHGQGLVKEYSLECSCRKPLPGMIYQAAREHDIDLAESWMIGDILHDVEAGNRAGCKTILINNGNETEWEYNKLRTPTYMVWNILEAAEQILEEEKNKG